MPRLLLLRHAKAERAHAGEKDFDRRLAEAGRAEAKEIGAQLAARGEAPDHVLCSSAKRTRETWEIVGKALPKAPKASMLRSIYEAEGDYIPILRDESGTAESVVLVGHNPAMQITAIRLAADLATPDGAVLVDRFPTGAVAIFEFDRAWEEIGPGSMRLVALIAPGEK